jgi:hypothetical protein
MRHGQATFSERDIAKYLHTRTDGAEQFQAALLKVTTPARSRQGSPPAQCRRGDSGAQPPVMFRLGCNHPGDWRGKSPDLSSRKEWDGVLPRFFGPYHAGLPVKALALLTRSRAFLYAPGGRSASLSRLRCGVREILVGNFAHLDSRIRG